MLDFDFQVTAIFLFVNCFLLCISLHNIHMDTCLVICTTYNVSPHIFIGAEVGRLTDMWLTVCTFSISWPAWRNVCQWTVSLILKVRVFNVEHFKLDPGWILWNRLHVWRGRRFRSQLSFNKLRNISVLFEPEFVQQLHWTILSFW